MKKWWSYRGGWIVMRWVADYVIDGGQVGRNLGW